MKTEIKYSKIIELEQNTKLFIINHCDNLSIDINVKDIEELYELINEKIIEQFPEELRWINDLNTTEEKLEHINNYLCSGEFILK